MLHVAKNTMQGLDPPLMLLIQGRAGEGKSSISREVLSRMNVNVVPLPGSWLSGTHEKEPVLILTRAYQYASSVMKDRNHSTVLLVDDLDTSVVSIHTDRRYTVNTQLLGGALMNLCDDPYRVGGVDTRRVPVIATGNDFTCLHAPLTRRGRARFFDWEPTFEMKVTIAREIFRPHLREVELPRIDQLVKHFSEDPCEPIAFYHALRDTLYDEVILQAIHESGNIDIAHLEQHLAKHQRTLSLESLIQTGDGLRQGRPRSFLAQEGQGREEEHCHAGH
jgi:AAA+ superfamily predicted ATPase